MKILQIVPELNSGGVERGTVDFASYLVRKGHHSIVVSAGGGLVKDMIANGVEHYTLPVHLKSLFNVFAQAKTLAKILRSQKVDVVHARSRVPAWIALIACRRVGIPLITTCHGVYSTHGLSRVMGWGRVVIAISNAVSRHMKQNFDVSHSRLRLIHRGVNLDEFEQADIKNSKSPIDAQNPFTIVIVGRITPIKGHPILLKAMARVTRVIPHVKLKIIGSSSKQRYLDELEHMTRDLNLQDSVEFMGSRPDVSELLKHAHLLVAPAVGEEAFGRVLIEAGACQIPVIASCIGGIVDIIEDGVDGFLVPASDPSALAETIIKVIRNPSHAAQMAKRLQRKVYDKFNDQLMFEKTLDVYAEVIERKRILIIKLTALGDVILSTASIKAIRNKFPNAHIAVLVERACREVLKDNPFIDDLITMEKPANHDINRLIRLGRVLTRERFDLVIDLQNNRLSRVLAYLSGSFVRLGYRVKKYDFLMSKLIPNEMNNINPIDHQFKLLEAIGVSASDKTLTLESNKSSRLWLDGFLKEHWMGQDQILVGINPGSSPQWKTKQWYAERYAKVIDELSHNNIRVILTGTKHDSQLIKDIVMYAKSKPINACAKTSIPELIALIERCEVFISSDSAPLHIAASVKTPFIAIFGPTDPRRHVPPSKLKHAVLWKQPKCSPCYLKKCKLGLICMKDISVNDVLTEVKRLLNSQAIPQSI